MKLILAIILLVFPFCAHAEYSATEILFIPWGDGDNQLKIAKPHYLDDNGTPSDYSDDTYEMLGGGPDYGTVDRAGNFYFFSYEHDYLKVFDPAGRVILDFSSGNPAYDSIIGDYSIYNFYVDTLSQIYVLNSPPRNYIPVLDTLGNLLDQLNPLGIGSGIDICRIFPNSDDRLSIYCCKTGYYFYSNGSFNAGGSMGWKAIDGNYHGAVRQDSSSIRFLKFSDSDIDGTKINLEETVISLGSNIFYAQLIGVDNNMNIFVFVQENKIASRIKIYDINYNLHDEVFPASRNNKYHWYIWPFMYRDGTIYEFRCRDDGMHVFRWSKK